MMVERKIGGLPVVDKQGSVVGVITETDIFRAFTQVMKQQSVTKPETEMQYA